MNYTQAQDKILNMLERTLFCTFATANAFGVVCAAQMCLVNDGLKVYIQTDKTFEKVKNILENPNVAINCGAYYFKGKAKILGHPKDNEIFMKKIEQKHPETFKSYTTLPNEVLIEVTLTECKIWGIDSSENVHNQKAMAIVDLVNKKVKTIACDKM